jgi:hypothetical protein
MGSTVARDGHFAAVPQHRVLIRSTSGVQDVGVEQVPCGWVGASAVCRLVKVLDRGNLARGRHRRLQDNEYGAKDAKRHCIIGRKRSRDEWVSQLHSSQ